MITKLQSTLKLSLFLALVFNITVHAQWSQVGETLDGNTGSSERFGRAVSLSEDGNTLAVGAYRDGEVYNTTFGWLDERGAVRIYEKQADAWVLQTEIDGIEPGENFGRSISLSSDGNTLVVGAPNAGNGTTTEWSISTTETGVVRVYSKIDNTWTQTGSDIVGENTGEYFGFSVDISDDGNTISAGAYRYSNNTGATRVYTNIEGTWTEVADINGSDEGDDAGYAVSLSHDGTTLAVGSYAHDSDKGTTRVYRDNSGTWSQIGSDIDGENTGDKAGFSVSLSEDGNALAIGAPANTSDDGTAYVYEYASGVWGVNAQLNGATGEGNEFGTQVSLNKEGSRVAVSATAFDWSNGVVKVYENQSNTWTQIGDDILSGASTFDFVFFGRGLALSGDGNTIAIGADAANNNDGFLKVFEYPEATASTNDFTLNDILFSVENGTIYTADNITVNIFDFAGKSIANQNLHGLYVVQFIDENNQTLIKKLLIK